MFLGNRPALYAAGTRLPRLQQDRVGRRRRRRRVRHLPGHAEADDSVPCEGDELYRFCKPCFRNYLTVTGTKGAGAPGKMSELQGARCTDHASCLSAWELEDLEARAAERDAAVALRGSDVAARLSACVARGVVLKGDEPEDGIVQCPGLPRL